MKIKIKRLDKTLPPPVYKTAGSCCFDLFSRTDIRIAPSDIGRIPCNLIIKVPAAYMLIILPRSSTPEKKGLLIPNGAGIIDQDYDGPTDEVMLQVLNFTKKTVLVKRGERLAQACLVKIAKAEFKEMEKIGQTNRGGFGSTG